MDNSNRLKKEDLVVLHSRNVRFLRSLLGVGVFLLGMLSEPPIHCQSPPIWTATWSSSQLQPYGDELLPAGAFDHVTLREIVHVSCGGEQIRIKLSNVFGSAPLVIHAVRLGLRSPGDPLGVITTGTSHSLSFDKQSGVSVPAGAEYLSDALDLSVHSLADLVIDIEIDHAPASVTLHTGAHASMFLLSGYHGGETQLAAAKSLTRWYFLSGVEVANSAGAVVTFGDSITDGHASGTDRNDRWPDVLAQRLAADPRTSGLGVANEGIGGNHLLHDGLGPSALARFDRDVLAQAGVRYVLVLEGINDLGELDRTEDHDAAQHSALLQQVESALRQLATRAHAHGIRVYGATLTPYLGSDYYHPNSRSEAARIALNAWIRASGTFDAVIDFDAAVRDPTHPDHMLAAADSGDHLHPGPAGYKRMGEAVPLTLFMQNSSAKMQDKELHGSTIVSGN